jgi:putative copper export protein
MKLEGITTMKLTKWPYIKKPLFIGLIIGIGVFFFCYFQELEHLKKMTKNLNNIIINISLTFIAFSVMALSLLSFVYNQEWFKKVAKSMYFESFIDRFFLSTKCTIILLFIAVICLLLEPYYVRILCSGINSVFIFSILFLSLWIWKCLDDLIDIFKS